MPTAMSSAAQKISLWTAALVASGWLVYFVFAPTIGFDLLPSWHNEQRALQVVLLLCTTLSYLFLSLVFSAVRFSAVIWMVCGLGAISTCFSDLPFHGVAEVALTVQLVLLGSFVATLIRLVPAHGVAILFCSAWLIGAVYVVGVAANYVGVIVEQRPVDLQVFILGYANQRFASALHALILPLLAWLAFDPSRRPAVRYSSWTIATLLWAINLAMGTRGIWAAFFVAGLALCWQGSHGGRQAVKALSFAAATGAIVYFLVWMFIPAILPQAGSIQSRAGDLESTFSRFDLWRAAGEAVLAHPLLGIGPMHFAQLHEPQGAHPHNWLLQFAAEWGLPALLATLFAMYFWLRRIRSALAFRAARTDYGALPAISLSVLATIVYGLMDGNWVMPVSQSLGVILLGASVGLLAERVPLQAGHWLEFPRIAVTIAVLATSATLAVYTYQTVGLQVQNEKDYVAEHHVQHFLPRFWQQGFIGEHMNEP